MHKNRIILGWVVSIFCASIPSDLAGAAERPNVLLICIDDLRPELHCYGVDYIRSPNIDQLAKEGRAYSRHYVQAPTCGASRFALLTGRYGGASNDALFQRATRLREGQDVPPSMPAWFRQHGYTTVSVGKVSHHPGGRGGPDWDDNDILEMPNSWDRHLLPAGSWQHPRGHMHGLANGEIRESVGKMDVFQSIPGDDSIYPDGLTIDESLRQIDLLAANDDKPFFLAVGIIRPHLPFGAPEKYMEPYKKSSLPAIAHPEKPAGKTNWHNSGEFMKYNRWKLDPNQDAEFADQVRKHYAACVTYADALVGRILDRVKEAGKWNDTIVVVWGDHGWHLGEHGIWGKHALFEESLRSPLIIRYQGMEQPGAATDAVVESIDIFPTLCDLTSLPIPEFAQGQSIVPSIEKPTDDGHPAISYFKRNRSIRTRTHRLIAHGDGFLELYDHERNPNETENTADANPEIAARLLSELNARHSLAK